MSPVVIIIGAVVLVAVVALLLLSSGGSKATAKKKAAATPEELKKLVAAGRYEQAARLEKKAGHYKAALEYYLRAQKPALAAQMAERLNKHREAAELYEKAENYQQAELCYRKAGVSDRADEMAEKLRRAATRDEARLSSSTQDALVGPEQRAKKLETECRELLRRAEGGDTQAQADLSETARQAAGALLQAGLTREAADLCRDAGLVDQAINLYVNLLGDPGAAALLLAQSGDHRRAAELFEAAGQKERALASWLDWSSGADDPLEVLEDVDRLGPEHSASFLVKVAESRPVTADNAELAYRIGRAMEERNLVRQAIHILEMVVDVAPKTQNAKARLETLRGAVLDGDRLGSVPASSDATSDPAAADEALALPDLDGPSEPELELPPPADPTAELGGADTLLANDDQPNSAPMEGADRGTGRHKERSGKATQVEVAAVLAERTDSEAGPDGQTQLPSPLLDKLVARAAGQAAAQVVRSMAASTVEELVRTYATTMTRVSPAVSHRMPRKMAQGIEIVPIPVTKLYDEEVEAARYGPTVDELLPLIQGKEPGLENIEVYYRLGLAYMKEGHWTEARKAFEMVEEISPGYRGAGKRATEIEKWQQALAAEEKTKDGKASIASQVSKRYEILGELGRGGMAVVYRARDRNLDREVGLKFLAEDMSSQPMIVEMFQREAKAAAQLNHPNIVTVYDFGVLDGRAFISMEFVRGMTVEQLLEQQGRLKVIDTLTVAEGILSALAYAHSKNIIHRDIKPSNMMIDEHGVVKLMDFGLAKWIDNQAKTTIVAGTPTYMAPEQFVGKGVDAGSDLFALGASLYEMLTGAPPFNGVDRSSEPTPIREKNPVVPQILDTLVLSTLEFDKRKRLGKAESMLAQVRTILEQVTSFASQQGPEESVSPGLSVRRIHTTATPRETKQGMAPDSSSSERPTAVGTKRGVSPGPERGTVLSKPRLQENRPRPGKEETGTVVSKARLKKQGHDESKS